MTSRRVWVALFFLSLARAALTESSSSPLRLRYGEHSGTMRNGNGENRVLEPYQSRNNALHDKDLYPFSVHHHDNNNDDTPAARAGVIHLSTQTFVSVSMEEKIENDHNNRNHEQSVIIGLFVIIGLVAMITPLVFLFVWVRNCRSGKTGDTNHKNYRAEAIKGEENHDDTITEYCRTFSDEENDSFDDEHCDRENTLPPQAGGIFRCFYHPSGRSNEKNKNEDENVFLKTKEEIFFTNAFSDISFSSWEI